MRVLLFSVWSGAAFLRLLGRLPNASASSVCLTRGDLRPPQPAQGLQGDQRAGQEHGCAIHMAEEEQEAEGEDVARQRQLSGPRLGEAEKNKKTCKRQFKKDLLKCILSNIQGSVLPSWSSIRSREGTKEHS